MSGGDSFSVTRRQFLGGCGTACAAAAAPATAATPPSPSLRSFGDGSNISLEGQAAIADVDRRFAQQRAPDPDTINAVEEWGLDPTGNEPINGAFEEGINGLSNARVVFPSDATFLVTDQMVLRFTGPVEIIGNGCTFKIPPDSAFRVMNIDQFPAGSLIRDIVLDQTAPRALLGFRIGTDGVARADNITIRGYATAENVGGAGGVTAMFSPVAYTSDAVLRMTSPTAVGGTAAGTHDKMSLPASAPENVLDAPIGVWIGRSNKGTVQLVGPELSGWSNGIYGGRTPGRFEVLGGKLVNNFNCQVRGGGGSVVDGATALLDDRLWQDKGPFKIGHQGVFAFRVDPSDIGNRTDPIRFKNCDIRAKSMRDGAALIDFEPEAGPGIIENCKITNHLDRSVILGESPSGGAGATNIVVAHCLIGGSSPEKVMEIHDRPQSRIQNTCIMIPDAGPEDIQGAEIGSGVSFGGSCRGTGLSAPKKVGSAGNISSLPAPSYNGSTGTISARTPTPSRQAIGASAGGMFAAIFGGMLGGLGMLVMMIIIIPVALLFLFMWLILSD